MRFLIASATALALLLVSSAAGEYEIRASLKAGSNDPANISVGDQFTYEVFLDTTNTVGESRITLFSVSYSYDPNVISYVESASQNHSYYPLYAPGTSKANPATWLQPIPFGDGACPDTQPDGMCGNNPPQVWGGNQSTLGAHINIDFIEVNLSNTAAVDTNLKISEITFEGAAAGSFAPEFSFNWGGNVFSVEGDDITDPLYAGPESIAATLQSGTAVSVPEPGLAGLALGALGTLGFLVFEATTVLSTS